MIRKNLIAGVLALMLCPTALAWECEEQRVVEQELDIGSLRDIQVEAGAGKLEIVGVKADDMVSIRAELCASDKEMLEKMDIETAVEEDFVGVATYIPKSWTGNYNAKIDLYLQVPKNSAMDVKDSSGDLRIAKVGSVNLVDSSGGITIKDIAGEVVLSDSSGGIDIKDIGSAEISDSSGGIDASNVTGDFTIHVEMDGYEKYGRSINQ